MKTTYEKVIFKKLSKAFKAHEKEGLYNKFKGGEYILSTKLGVFNRVNAGKYFYRKVEVKEPQKTVVDAVNYMRLNNLDDVEPSISIFYDDSLKAFNTGLGYLVCTIGQFNQCVEDMTDYSWNDTCELRNYEMYKKWFIHNVHTEALRENMAYDLYVIMCNCFGIGFEYNVFSASMGDYLMAIDLGVTVSKGE